MASNLRQTELLTLIVKNRIQHNMSALIVIFLISFSALFLELAYADKWGDAYGNKGKERVNSIEPLNGEFLLIGSTDANNNDALVMKLSDAGEIRWKYVYGGAGSDGISSIQATSDGGYILAGSTDSFGAGHSDAWVMKIDNDGTIMWQKTYGGAGNDGISSIQATSDGGYILAGSTDSFGAGYSDVWIIKVDNDGTVLWQKTYGGLGRDIAEEILISNDNNIVVAGETSPYDTGGYAWILKLDGNGNILWQKTYRGKGSYFVSSISYNNSGGYIVAGSEFLDNYAWVISLSADGAVEWQKEYESSNSYIIRSIRSDSANTSGYIAAGYTYYPYMDYDADVWTMKIDNNGAIIWQKTYGGYGDDYASSVRVLDDGGYIIARETYSFGKGDFDIWPLRLDINGETSDCSKVGTSYASEIEAGVKTIDTSATITDTTAIINDGSATRNSANILESVCSIGTANGDGNGPGSTTTTTVTIEKNSGGSKKSCFIATAAYGSYMADEVMILREFRDKYLITNVIGNAFVSFYYRISPPIAACISSNESLRIATRLSLTPIIYSIKYPFAAGFVTVTGVMATTMLRKRRLLKRLGHRRNHQ